MTSSGQRPAADTAAGRWPIPDEVYRAERKRVVRHFQRYTSEQRARHAASHRLGHRQRAAVGRYFYTHPDLPGVAFDTRGSAARAAVRAITPQELP